MLKLKVNNKKDSVQLHQNFSAIILHYDSVILQEQDTAGENPFSL